MPKYQPSRLKKAVRRGNRDLRLAKSVDVLIYLECVLFLKALARDATLVTQEDRQKVMQASHVRNVLPTVLQKFKG